MPIAWRFIVLSFFAFHAVAGQSLQYSRHLMRDPAADRMQLITDMEGYHHLISFSRGTAPSIDIFNPQLAYVERKEINMVTNEKTKISLLPFRNSYLVYIHHPGNREHRFFKVSGKGKVTEITANVYGYQPDLWTNPDASFQVLNQQERLTVISRVYSDSLRTLQFSITRFDENFSATQQSLLTFAFDRFKEKLSQLSLFNNQLLVLKEKKMPDGSHLLELSKIDLTSKKMTTREFSSGANHFSLSGLQINEQDSSLLLTSVLPEYNKKKGIQNVLFLSRLGDSLQELIPPVLLRDELNNDLSLNLLLLNNSSAGWIPFQHAEVSTRNVAFHPSSYTSADWAAAAAVNSPNYIYPFSLPLSSLRPPETGNYSPAGKIRLSLISDSLQVTQSILLKPYKDATVLAGRDLVSFRLHETPFLLIGQHLLRKQRGLALVYINGKQEITLTDIRANNQLDYFPELLKTSDDNHIIVPFRQRKEIGLLKINIKNYMNENN